MKRISLPLTVLALLAALAVTGCGGSDGEEATTGSGGQTTSAQRDAGGAGAADGGSATGGGGGAGGQSDDGGGEGLRDTGPRAPRDPENLPEPAEGSRRAAPGVPVSKGGDNSIQTWGTEASASEREEVTRILRAFYDARAAGDWARACTYLASRQKAEFASFVRGRGGNAACAEAMRGLASQVPASAFDKEARIDYVLSLRVGEGNAFLIYTRPGEAQVYANAFADEGGTWKVVSVGPSVVYR